MQYLAGLILPHIPGARAALLLSSMQDTPYVRCSSCTPDCTAKNEPSLCVGLVPATKTSNNFEIFGAGDSKKSYPLL